MASYSTCIRNLCGENHIVWPSFPEMHSYGSLKAVWSVLHCMMSKISTLQQELHKGLFIRIYLRKCKVAIHTVSHNISIFKFLSIFPPLILHQLSISLLSPNNFGWLPSCDNE